MSSSHVAVVWILNTWVSILIFVKSITISTFIWTVDLVTLLLRTMIGSYFEAFGHEIHDPTRWRVAKISEGDDSSSPAAAAVSYPQLDADDLDDRETAAEADLMMRRMRAMGFGNAAAGVKKQKPNERCACGSGNKFKKCCGQL